MSNPVFFLVLIIVQVSLLESVETDLCSNPFCACGKDIKTGLSTLNCTFDFQQDLVLSEKSLPFEDYIAIELNNINELNISPLTFNKKNWGHLKKIKFRNINKLNVLTQYYGISSLVHFENVTIPEISSNAFPILSELRIVSCNIRVIRSKAFGALDISSISIENTSIQHVENGAFSEQSLLNNLRLDHVYLKTLDSNAILSGINNLSIQHSNITDIYHGGINNTVATVQLSNNIISNVEQNGIIINDWNYIVMENNTFKTLQTNAISIYCTHLSKDMLFEFVGNALGEIKSNSLNFDFNLEEINTKDNNTKGLKRTVRIDENYFVKTCDCDFFNFLKNAVNSDIVQLLYETSFCNINHALSQCFNKPEGLLNIKNFTDTICVQHVICNTKTNIETTKTRMFPGLTSTFELVFDGNENEDLLVRYACAALVILMLVILLCIACLYIRQNRVLSKVKSNVFMNIYSKMFTRNSSDKCQSKTKMFTNDYSELNKNLKIEMSDITLDSQIHGEHIYVNKATQTLPEELTQELLQNLRFKLEDPNEYCLARDMIEHLYDLIKIEESCNNNVYSTRPDNHYMASVIADPTDNIYDEIEIRPNRADTSTSSSKHPKYRSQFDFGQSRSNVLSTFQRNMSSPDRTLSPSIIKNKKKFVSVGTRVPSPDKLLPYDFPNIRTVTLLDEYQMPRDNKSSYIYSELISSSPDKPQEPRDQLKLLDDAINIYIDTSLRRSRQNDLYHNRPLPSKPEPPDCSA
ncbi:hypothetical protein M8J75_001510 [Diaphorina citri]|nr:hypothetical protein M8J75_001510 [Diaphorina citri]